MTSRVQADLGGTTRQDSLALGVQSPLAAGDAHRELRKTYLLTFAYTLAWHMLAPLVPLYVAARGGTPMTVGLVVSASGFLPLLLGIHIGVLVDGTGPTRILQFSAVLYLASFAILVSLPGVPLLALAYALVNLGHLGLSVATQTLVAAWSRGAAERARNYGYLTFWVSAGMVAGPFLSGLLLDVLGYRSAFLAVLILTIPVPILTRISGSVSFRPQFDAAAAGASRRVGRVLRTEGTAGVLVLSFLLIFVYSLKQSFYPLYLQQVGLSTTLIGGLFAIYNIGGMAVRPLIGNGVARLGYVPMFGISLGLAAAGLAATPLLRQFTLLAFAAIMIGIANGVTQPLTMSLITGAVPPDFHGLALGLRMSAQRLATVLGPVALGLVVAVFGLGSAFYVGAAIIGAAVVVLVAFPRSLLANHGYSRAYGSTCTTR